jgi:hypothetical protein
MALVMMVVELCSGRSGDAPIAALSPDFGSSLLRGANTPMRNAMH